MPDTGRGDTPVNPGDIVTGTLGDKVAMRFGIVESGGEVGCQQWLWTPATAREVAASLVEMAGLAERRAQQRKGGG